MKRTAIIAFGFCLTTVGTRPAVAQEEPDSSLAERIEQLERLVDILQVQVAEQAGAAVSPRSGNYVELSGLVLVNGFSNSANVFMDDVPQWVLPPDPDPSLPNKGGSATIRQTRLTLTAFANQVLGAELTGELDVDFFGGQHRSSGGRTFPNLRIRRTRAQLDWRNFTVLIGQEAPPIAPLNPSSLAAVGFPGFTGSGNLWLWLPQVRVRAHTAGNIRLGIEGAALAPTDGEPRDEPFYNEPDVTERSQRPFVQGRLVAEWGPPGEGGELSVGAHLGWFATTGDTLLESRAAAVAARIPLGRYFEIRGEAFVGEALRTLGGGGIYQNFGAGGVPLETRGGWAQLNIMPSPGLEVGGGAGLDDPDDDGLGIIPGRGRNITYEGHVIWRPSPLVFAAEFRRLETTFYDPVQPDATLANNHVNVAAGFEF